MLAEFEKTFGITFGNPALLKLALTHRSYLHVTGAGPRDSNERLEFLGDSVLGLVTSEHLYRRNPGEHEGQLTKTKSLLVSKAILSRRALAMGLGRFVLMSHSEVESGGRQRLSILADAFEAVIGSIYLDQGFGAARSFIERWLLREARVIVADKRHTNYKSHLQEYVQSTFRTHPVYRIRSAMGPDHSKQFMVEVMVGRKVLGEGRGRNKKEAEQAAARDALEQVGETSGGAPAQETPAPARGAVDTRPARRSPAPAPAVESERDDEDESPRRRGRRGDRERGTGERESRRESIAPSPTPPPRPVRPASPAPPPPPPRPVLRRAAWDDEHEEIGRPEGPDDAAEAMTPRERPAPRFVEPAVEAPAPPKIETPVARELELELEPEPEPEPQAPREVPVDEPESESFATPDRREESRTAATAPEPPLNAPVSPESQSFGRRRKPGRR